ncbi:hypothetical protein GQ54DRAFT_189192 [Martensiomyces pterosporus]|nr:hypothetical protein GQ54DRAFT_189192 [Martensiomyces pterosporus]
MSTPPDPATPELEKEAAGTVAHGATTPHSAGTHRSSPLPGGPAAAVVKNGGTQAAAAPLPRLASVYRPAGRPRPPPSTAPGSTQLLRRIVVAGVTVEVVRQKSTIIYRLPGNMPVSSLTPEQRTKVMNEIQRMRNSTQSYGSHTPAVHPGTRPQGAPKSIMRSASSSPGLPGTPPPGPAAGVGPAMKPTTAQQIRNQPLGTIAGTAQNSMQPVRPRPILPSIAPRQIHSHMNTSTAARAPRSPSVSSPTTPKSISGTATRQQQSQSAPTKKAPLHSTGAAPTTAANPQMAALEKMYRSAYMKLLNGPAEILRKLSPPVELSAIVKSNGGGGHAEDTRDPDMLLHILKALTKSQASQLASMREQDVKAGRGPNLGVNTGGLRTPTPGSRPHSGEVSPSADSVSGAETDGVMHPPTPSAATPTKKRKYNKTGKYSVKKRPTWTPGGGPQPHIEASSVGKADECAANPQRPVKHTHPDLNRVTRMPLAERRKQLDEIKHETEVGRRFREALAMDHQMVRSPDWRTPFRGTRDVIQRLLPFHVFQYLDGVIDSGITREDQAVAASSGSLAARLKRLANRYDGILIKEGSQGCHDISSIQIENHRISDARHQLDQMQDAQLQRNISSAMMSRGSAGIASAALQSAIAGGPAPPHTPKAHPLPPWRPGMPDLPK